MPERTVRLGPDAPTAFRVSRMAGAAEVSLIEGASMRPLVVRGEMSYLPAIDGSQGRRAGPASWSPGCASSSRAIPHQASTEGSFVQPAARAKMMSARWSAPGSRSSAGRNELRRRFAQENRRDVGATHRGRRTPAATTRPPMTTAPAEGPGFVSAGAARIGRTSG